MSYEYAPATQNNRMALVSMISGIVAWAFVLINICLQVLISVFAVATMGIGSVLLCCLIPLTCISPIGWLVAVITGHIGNNQVKVSGEGGAGMAKAGLIMGYIGVGLILLGFCVGMILTLTGASLPFIDEFIRNMGL